MKHQTTRRIQPPLESQGRLVPSTIYRAITDERPDLILEAVKEDPPRVHWTDTYYTLLHTGVRLDSPELVTYVLAHGLDIEAKTRFGDTALTLAACLRDAQHPNNEEIIRILIEHGADLYACGHCGYTAMGRAIHQGNVEQVRFLVQQGVDIYHVVGSHDTPVAFAEFHRKVDVAQVLCELGVDPSFRTTTGRSILHSLTGRSPETVRLLIAAASNVDVQDESFGNTALHSAALGGRQILAQLLLDGGANIESRNHDGMTPLMYAATGRDATMVSYLLTCHVDVNAHDNSGTTALSYAIRFGTGDTVRTLIKAGADPDAYGGSCSAPIHYLPSMLNRREYKERQAQYRWRDLAIFVLSRIRRFDGANLHSLSIDALLSLIEADKFAWIAEQA